MKKLINNADDVTREQLSGFARAYEALVSVHFDPTFVVRRSATGIPGGGKAVSGPQNPDGHVAVISGGGSGHEPLHAGFVGEGMLDAACPGQIFTSPTPDQMFEAAKAVAGPAGVLFIVKNYSGDVMNFQMAAELLRGEGIVARNITIDDDVAVKDSLYTAGRRGTGTTLFAEKICGAAAARGYDLARLADLCRKVSLRGKSMGVALGPCVIPANGKPSFELPPDTMEIGIGIHGEPGVERAATMSADEVTDLLVTRILDDGSYTRALTEWSEERGDWAEVELTDEPFKSGDGFLVLVNGMGGTPIAELYTVYGRLAEILESRGMSIAGRLIGNYITSLEMQGCLITLVKADEELLRLWDAPVRTPALQW